jgi:hypothetical protein
MSNNFTIKKSVFHANEDGTSGSQIIDVTFNAESMVFSVMLPPHVADYNGNAMDPEISGDTAQGVIETYEVRCDEYSRWRLSIGLPTQLWIGVYLTAGDFAKQTFGFTHVCGIGASPVKVLPDGGMIEVRDDGSLGNPVGSKGSVFQPVLIEDKPDHRAKVQALAQSIQQAADILAGLRIAVDPAAYLMQISETWAPPAPFQAALPFDPPVVKATDDDDEL